MDLFRYLKTSKAYNLGRVFYDFKMDSAGFEPATPCMPCRCATVTL